MVCTPMTKTNVNDLAIFGGAPEFDEPLHVGRPNIGDRARLMQRIDAILDSGRLTNEGPFVRAFEEKLAAMTGVRNCIAICNGTVALEIVIRAAGLTGEVIVPSYTFIATAHALQWQEITPVFCDIDPETHTLDPEKVERMITPRTTGIIGVHLWGRPSAVDELTAIAERRGLTLLFDAAHALGSTYKGRQIGGFGRAEMLSFHATKFVNSMEGGAILTNDDELAARVRLMKNFGFAGLDNVIYIGTNGKMPEVSAAFGLTSLENIDAFIAANEANYLRYRTNFDGIAGLTLLRVEDGGERRNFQYVVLEIDEAEAGIGRDALVTLLTAENVLARRYFWPGCHRMEPYRSLFPRAGQLLPETERVARRVVVLPTGTSVSTDDIDRVCALIRFAAANHAEIAERREAAAR
jgi:dTDP-4-amino-4,6-dideoxygalactose transaminase